MTASRTIRVDALTRVEGEGGLFVRLQGREVEQVRLDIYEPPRLFESLLRGRRLEDVPDITARICGICPVAYQMSSVHALERALGVTVTPELRRLRRLLYCGEWIESHALHMFLLHVPDFLGYESAIAMAADHADRVQQGLDLKKYGNLLLERLGGRAVHPVNVAVGGFYRIPSPDQFSSLVADFERCLDVAVELTRWVAGFEFPDFDRTYEMIALVNDDEYPMNEGHIGSTAGWTADVAEFDRRFAERQVPHSTALHCVRADTKTTYFLGPAARVSLNVERLSPSARKLVDDLQLELPIANPFRSVVARGVEIVHAFEEAISILKHPPTNVPPRVDYEPRAGEGCAATEAPRGLLYHDYEVDADGQIAKARIIPPTSQNLAQIEDDLRDYVGRTAFDDDAELAVQCERLVRSYDPCISCSTHFLNVVIERGDVHQES